MSPIVAPLGPKNLLPRNTRNPTEGRQKDICLERVHVHATIMDPWKKKHVTMTVEARSLTLAERFTIATRVGTLPTTSSFGFPGALMKG